jgi:peptidoglycan/LPS O-acetylase OafA/YrhL
MRLNSIQFLRALAAILVVYTHSINKQAKYAESFQQDFYFLKDFGAIGVDIFFNISGFIISYVASKYKGLWEGIGFLKKRFYRINPVYYFVSITYISLLLFTDYPLSWPDIIRGCRDMVIMIPILNSQTILLPILLVGWTLSFEWWFYLLFFLLMFFRVNNKELLFFIMLSSLVIIGYIFHVQDFRLIFITNPIMLEFLSGVAIYWLYYHAKVSNWIAGLLILLGLIGCLYTIFTGYGDIFYIPSIFSGYSSMKRVLLWGVPSTCIVAGCVFYEKNGILSHLWNNWVVLLIGNASYSIYLIHAPILYSMGIIYSKSGFILYPDLVIWLQVLVAIGGGTLFYKIIEKPLLGNFRSKPISNIRALTW